MKKIFVILMGAVMLFGLFGCGMKRYKLQLAAPAFRAEKTAYREGETVKVCYDLIATDTNYSFFTDSADVEPDVSYDSAQGYVITFEMPAHDVVLDVSSRNSMVYDGQKRITVINQTTEAKIWILQDIAENRKTTLWGEAQLPKAAAGEEQCVILEPAPENSRYLLRMIDTDKMYYEANDLALEDGQTMVIREGEWPMEAVLELYDADGTFVCEYPVFKARV